MNKKEREETQRRVEVMMAYIKGKQIQFRTAFDDGYEWKDCDLPSWNWDLVDFRVKPEEDKPILMTNEQLSEWLSKGKGVKGMIDIRGKVSTAYTSHTFNLDEADKQVDPSFRIRAWRSKYWIIPTTLVYLKDCVGVDVGAISISNPFTKIY